MHDACATRRQRPARELPGCSQAHRGGVPSTRKRHRTWLGSAAPRSSRLGAVRTCSVGNNFDQHVSYAPIKKKTWCGLWSQAAESALSSEHTARAAPCTSPTMHLSTCFALLAAAAVVAHSEGATDLDAKVKIPPPRRAGSCRALAVGKLGVVGNGGRGRPTPAHHTRGAVRFAPGG